MNIVFNECIFAYLCLFYGLTKYFHEFQSIFVSFYRLTKYFHEFQSIFVSFRFIDIFVKISTDIFPIFPIYL